MTTTGGDNKRNSQGTNLTATNAMASTFIAE